MRKPHHLSPQRHLRPSPQPSPDPITTKVDSRQYHQTPTGNSATIRSIEASVTVTTNRQLCYNKIDRSFLHIHHEEESKEFCSLHEFRDTMIVKCI
eukprot:scaffold3374_cov267-Chaetoceros_neogracile.AAC.5